MFFAARAARPANRDVGLRAMSATSSLPYGLWRDRDGALDITSSHNPKVKLMRCVHVYVCIVLPCSHLTRGAWPLLRWPCTGGPLQVELARERPAESCVD